MNSGGPASAPRKVGCTVNSVGPSISSPDDVVVLICVVVMPCSDSGVGIPLMVKRTREPASIVVGTVREIVRLPWFQFARAPLASSGVCTLDTSGYWSSQVAELYPVVVHRAPLSRSTVRLHAVASFPAQLPCAALPSEFTQNCETVSTVFRHISLALPAHAPVVAVLPSALVHAPESHLHAPVPFAHTHLAAALQALVAFPQGSLGKNYVLIRKITYLM